MTSPAQCRDGVRVLMERGVSQRRACFLTGLSRSSFHYVARAKEDALVLEQLRAIATRHPRYGYRRAWALLRRGGDSVNHKRVYRLWKCGGLSVKKRRPKKRRVKTGQSVRWPCSRPIRWVTGRSCR